ncbi:MAG: IclR family transcriptional regulator [Pigmentiphaga sp.]
MPTKENEPTPRMTEGGVEAVDRALWILKALTEEDASLTLVELSTRTGFYKSTILRLLASLENYGYIIRQADKSYALGFELTRLNGIRQSQFRLEDYVRPILISLRDATQETASFYQRVGNKRVCIYREETRHNLREHIPEGTVFPLDESAAGLVLRQSGGPASRKGAAPYPASLPEISIGKRDPDLAAIAAPAYDAGINLIGAVSISGPRTRLERSKIDRMGPIVIEHAKKLSRLLGAPV